MKTSCFNITQFKVQLFYYICLYFFVVDPLMGWSSCRYEKMSKKLLLFYLDCGSPVLTTLSNDAKYQIYGKG